MALEWECQWCGNDLPDHRMHMDTCSEECRRWLRKDATKRANAAVSAAAAQMKPPPKPEPRACTRCYRADATPSHKWCRRCTALRRGAPPAPCRLE